MNKLLLGPTIAVALFLFAIGAYLAIGRPSQTPEIAPEQPDSQEPSETAESSQYTIRQLLDTEAPIKCDIYGSTENEGVVYAMPGHVRGDFEANYSGRTLTTHVILKDGISYVWLNSESTGFTASIDAVNELSEKIGGVNMDEELSYQCSPWVPDESVFVLPVGVSFQDVGSFLLEAINLIESTNPDNLREVQCNACDKLEERLRLDCKALFGC